MRIGTGNVKCEKGLGIGRRWGMAYYRASLV